MKYRITHPDPHNWCIETWQPGGLPISRGKYAGQETQARWMQPDAFYPSLRYAALALIDKAAGDALLVGEANNILEAIQRAELAVQGTLAACVEMGVAVPTSAVTE